MILTAGDLKKLLENVLDKAIVICDDGATRWKPGSVFTDKKEKYLIISKKTRKELIKSVGE